MARIGRVNLGRRAASAIALVVLAASWPAASAPDEVALSQLGLERFPPESGLAARWVTDVAEDREGFLWVATAGGLSRFDGRTFRNFTAATEPELSSSAANALAVGADGRVWVGLEHGGVRVLEGGRLRRDPRAAGLPEGAVRSLAADRSGNLWIGTTRGLWRLGAEGLSAAPLPVEGREADVSQVVVAGDGRPWARTRGAGLWRIDGETATRVTDPPGCLGLSLAFTREGNPVTSCVDGIWEKRSPDSGWTLVSPGKRAHRILVDRRGALWLGAEGGLTRRLPEGRTEVLVADQGVGDERIRALFEDSRGGIWVGTFGTGLWRLRRGAARAQGEREGLPRLESTAVAVDASGDLWVGTHNRGIYRWREGTGVVGHLTVANGLPSDRVLALAADPVQPGRAWLGTSRGIAELERGSVRRVGRPGGRTEEEVTILLADPVSRETVWAGGPAGGLDELRGDTVLRHDESNGLRAGRVRALARVRSGTLIVAGDEGLYRLERGRWREMAPEGEGLKSLRALAEGADGTLWLASAASGLHRWSGGRRVRLGEREGLPFNRIFSLELDASGGLWLSGDEGLVRLKVDDVERWARGDLGSVPVARLSARDGLRDIECNGWGRPASCRLPSGTIVYPTAGGIALIDPARLPNPELTPDELYVDTVFTGSRELPADGPLRLGSGERDLRLRFGAVEFDFPESVLFRYRLEGLDERWVPAGLLSEATYSRLLPGRYRFRLQARLPGREWVEARRAPEVEVIPALSETTWFRALSAALLLSAVAALVTSRFRVQRAHAEALTASREELRRLATALLRAQEEERAKLARELHDDLTQRIVGLAMLTGVHAQAVRRGAGRDLSQGLEEIERELEKLAADSQSLSRELHPSLLENVGLDGALRAECATFSARTGIRVVYDGRGVPADLSPEVGIVVYRITQEALRNVLSHSGAGEARVTLEGSGEVLTLSVEDAGSGFDPSAPSPGSGLGLASMQERARLVRGRLTVESRPGAGTKVLLVVRPDARSGVFAALR